MDARGHTTAVHDSKPAVDGGQALPCLSAIIVHHRTPDHTLAAIRSLRASARRPDQVIVVNNDDRDDGGLFLGVGRESVVWKHTGRNLGFSGGVNAGIQLARANGAATALLMNSDASVSADCIGQLETTLGRVPGAGIIGPLVLSPGDPPRVASMGLRYHTSSGRMRHLGFGWPAEQASPGGWREVDGVAGCLMLIPIAVFDRVGLFDEDFFFGFEELEFCFRARRAGFTSVVDPAATVYHEGGASIGRTKPRRLYFAARNHLLLAHKIGPHDGVVRRAARGASIAALNLAHALTADGGWAGARIGAVLRGTLDYLGGRYGPDYDAPRASEPTAGRWR